MLEEEVRGLKGIIAAKAIPQQAEGFVADTVSTELSAGESRC